jgi:hypothetical protein
MSNKDLLKQAIAEAKTIREAAIANAKEALEETLTPHLKDMLAAKLQEMEDKEDEEVMDENIYEAEKEEVETEEEEEAEEEGNEEEGEEEEVEIEDMSIEDLKDLIRDIVSQEVGHDESEEEIAGEEAPEGEDLTGMDSDEEEIDINELLAELNEMDKEEVKKGNINEMGPEYIEGARELVEMFPFLDMSMASLIIGALGSVGLIGFSVIAAKVQDMALAGKFGGAAKSFAEKLQAAGKGAAKAIHNREGVEESMKEMSHESDKMDENMDIIYELINAFPFLTNSTAQLLVGVFGSAGIFGLSAIMAKVHQMAKDGFFGEGAKKVGDKLTDIGNAAAGARNVSEESEELNEALKTVKILRNQLQEVNLLNAKLLYVNKVFKSTNLSEGQKVNVIAAFDKAETVREVKLVFETVSKNVVAKPATIKEHRSFASKATGVTTRPNNPEIISEVSETVKRMQKLAGIIK